LRISQFSQFTEELPACSLHLFPRRIGIHDAKSIGEGATSAQSDSQIVYGIRAELHAGAVALLEHSFHPKSEACFLLGDSHRRGS
jgi:hypothetical protein